MTWLLCNFGPGNQNRSQEEDEQEVSKVIVYTRLFNTSTNADE